MVVFLYALLLSQKSPDKGGMLSVYFYPKPSQVETLIQTGKAKEAVKICRSSLKIFPSSVSLWQQYFRLRLTGIVQVLFWNIKSWLWNQHLVDFFNDYLVYYNYHDTCSVASSCDVAGFIQFKGNYVYHYCDYVYPNQFICLLRLEIQF